MFHFISKLAVGEDRNLSSRFILLKIVFSVYLMNELIKEERWMVSLKLERFITRSRYLLLGSLGKRN